MLGPYVTFWFGIRGVADVRHSGAMSELSLSENRLSFKLEKQRSAWVGLQPPGRTSTGQCTDSTRHTSGGCDRLGDFYTVLCCSFIVCTVSSSLCLHLFILFENVVYGCSACIIVHVCALLLCDIFPGETTHIHTKRHIHKHTHSYLPWKGSPRQRKTCTNLVN